MEAPVVRLAPADLDRLQKICAMFASNFPGERATAAAMADRMLRDCGLRWADVLTLPAPPPHETFEVLHDWPVRWRGALGMCLLRGGAGLTDRDRAFLASIAGYAHRPSPRQLEWLRNIVDRIVSQEYAGTR